MASPLRFDAVHMSHLNINKLHFPVTTLGPGKRIGLWLQGCSIRCPGCISRDTWDADDSIISVVELIRFLSENWFSAADGLTVSGGEPLDQPEALKLFLTGIRDQFDGDVLLYSGFEKDKIDDRFAWVSDTVDALISGPFRQDLPTDSPLRGSANQELHLFTESAKSNYINLDTRNAVDLAWDGNSAWLSGIPGPNDWPELKNQLSTSGLTANFSDDRQPK